MRQDPKTIKRMLAAVVEAMGYELVDLEFRPSRENTLLRIYLDSENGIGLDDCQRVSHQVSGVLEVEDPIEGRYTLEVSSPGLDRPLREAAHFSRFAGSRARLQLREPLEGRRRLTGRLLGLRDDAVAIVDDAGREWRVPLERIDKARLAPNGETG